MNEVYRCVHCGFCLPTCPTYLATGSEGHSPRGRLYIIRAVLEGRAEPRGRALEYLDSCVYCLRCETACPSGVKYGQVYREFMKRYPALGGVTYGRYMPLFNLLNTSLGLAAARAAPLKAIREVASGGDVAPLVGRVYKAKGERRGRVVLYFSKRCIAWRWRRDVVEAAVRVLTWNGFEVATGDFHCCGAPYSHAGRFKKAHALAKENLKTLRRLGPFDAVVVPNSGGCQAELLDYVDGVYDVLQFLGERGLRGELGPLELRIAVQHSCHLANVAKAHRHVVEVLSRIPGLQLVELPSADVCCGGGNMYSLRHRRVADAILEIKKREIDAVSPHGVLIESPACVQQLSRLPYPLYYPVVLLDMSYRRGGNVGYGELNL
ncbi:MAG: (Fe-S)-binding protein [Pyrobaculum sp.]